MPSESGFGPYESQPMIRTTPSAKRLLVKAVNPSFEGCFGKIGLELFSGNRFVLFRPVGYHGDVLSKTNNTEFIQMKLFTISIALLAVTACGGKITDDTGSNTTDTGSTTGTDGLDISADCSDDSSNICDLQTGMYNIDDSLTITGIVAGDPLRAGFFVVAPQGGAWSGVWVYTGTPASQEGVLMSGDEVSITGTYLEYDFGTGGDSVTELAVADAADVTVVSTGNALPPYTTVTATELLDAEIAEAFESSPVRVANATVTALPDEYGDWMVDGTVDVAQHFVEIPEALAVGDTFTAIEGMLYSHYNKYKLVPVVTSGLSGWNQ
jgi:hypothetical protein